MEFMKSFQQGLLMLVDELLYMSEIVCSNAAIASKRDR